MVGRLEQDLNEFYDVHVIEVLVLLLQLLLVFVSVAILATCVFDNAASCYLGVKTETDNQEKDKGNSFHLYESCYV
jgi:hypothetical protein